MTVVGQLGSDHFNCTATSAVLHSFEGSTALELSFRVSSLNSFAAGTTHESFSPAFGPTKYISMGPMGTILRSTVDQPQRISSNNG